MDEVTEDRVLGGRVMLLQPKSGLRAAIDPVLLAAAVAARPGESVLELGTGTGVAALCLARRLPGVRVVGLEIQPMLADLARRNARANALDVATVCGDVATAPFTAGCFDQVIANPPFLEAGTGTLPPAAGRSRAVGEGATALRLWVATALSLVRRRGRITFIHRADRLGDLLAALDGVGEITILPLWPAEGQPARRVIVRARSAVATPLRLAAGLVLHGSDGAYTPAAEAVLRDAASLPL